MPSRDHPYEVEQSKTVVQDRSGELTGSTRTAKLSAPHLGCRRATSGPSLSSLSTVESSQSHTTLNIKTARSSQDLNNCEKSHDIDFFSSYGVN